MAFSIVRVFYVKYLVNTWLLKLKLKLQRQCSRSIRKKQSILTGQNRDFKAKYSQNFPPFIIKASRANTSRPIVLALLTANTLLVCQLAFFCLSTSNIKYCNYMSIAALCVKAFSCLPCPFNLCCSKCQGMQYARLPYWVGANCMHLQDSCRWAFLIAMDKCFELKMLKCRQYISMF